MYTSRITLAKRSTNAAMSHVFAMLYPLVTLLSISGYLPQIWNLIRATSPNDSFALSGWVTWIATSAISLGYGIFHLKDVMFSITTGSSLVLITAVVSMVLYNRHYRFRKAAAAGNMAATPVAAPAMATVAAAVVVAAPVTTA